MTSHEAVKLNCYKPVSAIFITTSLTIPCRGLGWASCPSTISCIHVLLVPVRIDVVQPRRDASRDDVFLGQQGNPWSACVMYIIAEPLKRRLNNRTLTAEVRRSSTTTCFGRDEIPHGDTWKKLALWGSCGAKPFTQRPLGPATVRNHPSSLSTRSLYNVPRPLKFGAGVLHLGPASFDHHHPPPPKLLR